MDHIAKCKSQNSHVIQNIIRKINSKAIDWEKIFVIDISNTGLVSKIFIYLFNFYFIFLFFFLIFWRPSLHFENLKASQFGNHGLRRSLRQQPPLALGTRRYANKDGGP